MENIRNPHEDFLNSKNLDGINTENLMPEYQNFVTYAELYAVKPNDLTILFKNDGSIQDTFTQKGDNKVVNFLGYDSETQTYTSRYTDDIVGEPIRYGTDEGFGMTNISIDITAKQVPVVEIEFIDVKGSSFANVYNRETNDKVGYRVLLDYPPPTFVLTMKGIYGPAVRYVLHVLNNDITFDSDSGNFIIKSRFVGKTFAPLSDLKIGYVKAAPYIYGNEISMSLNPKDGVNTFYELVERGQTLYNEINDLISTGSESEKIKKNNEKKEDLLNLLDKASNGQGIVLPDTLQQTKAGEGSSLLDGAEIDNTINGYVIYDTSKGSGADLNVDDTKLFRSTDEKFSYTDVLFSNQKSDVLNKTQQVITDYVGKELLTDEFKTLIQASDYRQYFRYVWIYNKKEDGTPDKTSVRIILIYTKYAKSINDEIAKIDADNQAQSLLLKNKVDDSVLEELGFKPTIHDVMKILCDDIDIFFNKLKNVGTSVLNSGRKLKSDNGLFVDASEPFPRVSESVNTSGKVRNVDIYPGKRPELRKWDEVKFVEEFIKVYLKQRKEEFVREEIKEGTNSDGSELIIPSSPLERLDSSLQNELGYSTSDSVDNIFLKLFKRYVIATQYTYKGNFTENGNTSDDEKRQLIKFMAQAEAKNIAVNLFDNNSINAMIIILDQLKSNDNGDNYLQSFQAYFNSKNDLKNSSDYFTDTNKVLQLKDSYTVANKTFYSDKNNPEFKGLSVTKIEEIGTPITDSSQVPNETPQKLYLDAINGLGFFRSLGLSGESDDAELTTKNIIYFKDVKREIGETSLLSDFIKEGSNNIILKLNMFNTDCTNNEFLESFFSSFYYFKDLRINNKFYTAGCISMPRFYVDGAGYILINGSKYIKQNLNDYLSVKDRQFFIDSYNENKSMYDNLLSDYKKFKIQVENIDDYTSIAKTQDFIVNMMEEVFILNESSLTFIKNDTFNNINQNVNKNLKFYNLGYKNSNAITYFEDTNQYDLVEDITIETTKNKRFNDFFGEFKIKLLEELKQTNTKAKQFDEEMNNILRDNDLKSQLYYDFKKIYDRWIKGSSLNDTSSNSGGTASSSYPYAFGKSLIDRFKFFDRGYTPIGKECVIDFTNLIDYAKTNDSEVYGAITSVLAKNNFEFFPIPNYIDYNQSDNLARLFKLETSAVVTTEPIFLCMYVGGFNSIPEDNIDIFGSTNDNIANLPPDMSGIYGFNIDYGIQNQSIFKNISLSTSESKNTSESLKLMDDIIAKGKDKSPIPKGQNLYNVYENRSYSTNITIPLGNMMIQPTMYFIIRNVPIFNGIYIILSVSHKMNSNNKIETSFKGYRVGKYIKPFITSPFLDIGGISEQLGDIIGKNITGTAVPKLQLIPNVDYVRLENKITPLFVQPSGNNYIPYNISFTKNNIDYNQKDKITV